MTFRVGDRVHCPWVGDGTIIVIDDNPPEIGVRLDESGPSMLQLIHREPLTIDPEEFLSLLSRKEDHP